MQSDLPSGVYPRNAEPVETEANREIMGMKRLVLAIMLTLAAVSAASVATADSAFACGGGKAKK